MAASSPGSWTILYASTTAAAVARIAASPAGPRPLVAFAPAAREIVDGRKLRFEVEVDQAERTVGVGTHERRVIDAAGPTT